MTTRSLSFASLFFAAAQPAMAMDPIAEVAAANEPAAPTTIKGEWTQQIKDGELVLDLKLVNTGSHSVDVLVARGKMPGPNVQATINGVALTRMFTDSEMSGQMSRMGPMPRFAPVAGKKELTAGTFRFQLPEGYAGAAIYVDATVDSNDGTIPLHTAINAGAGV